MMVPFIFDIKRASMVDGPGIRTTVFVKGCPLRCSWCHNPEALDKAPELFVRPVRCVGCDECSVACPHRAARSGQVVRRRCRRCFSCSEICPSGALQKVGRQYRVDELVASLLRDKTFYQVSRGGVTFSGGEPTLFPEYFGVVMRKLKREGVDITLQTCGLFDRDLFISRMLPFIDRVYFDLKLVDPIAHQRHTGQPNDTIIANFIDLSRHDSLQLIPTILLVPGITAQRDNLEQLVALMAGCDINDYQVRPYLPGGEAKQGGLGIRTGNAPIQSLSLKEEEYWTVSMQQFMNQYQKKGKNAD